MRREQVRRVVRYQLQGVSQDILSDTISAVLKQVCRIHLVNLGLIRVSKSSLETIATDIRRGVGQ